MRALATPPTSVLDPRTAALNSGSFRGTLPRVDLGPLGKGTLYRLTHLKKWLYLAIASDDLFVGVALVDLGYVVSTFGFAFDRTSKKMLVDRSALGHGKVGHVSDGVGEGFEARFSQGKTHVDFTRPRGDALNVSAAFADFEVHARIDVAPSHPALSAIGPIPGGVVNATEKQALLSVVGEVRVNGEKRSLDHAVAGYDYTHGYLARHTQWRWAYALGRAKTGERIAFNLVEGFLGELECGVWIDSELHPVGEGRFTLDVGKPLDPWSIRTTDGALDLRFVPGGMHSEEKNFGVVRSRFLQPVGFYSGTIDVAGRKLELESVLGVAEDQDVKW